MPRFGKPAILIAIAAVLAALVLPAAWTAASAQQKPAAPPGQPPPPPPPHGQPQPQQPPPQGQAGQGGQGEEQVEPDLGNIDEILEGEEEVLSGSSFSYDPGNRRDPFKSLLTAPDRPELRGPRPEGVPGLLIDEIDLTGIFRTPKGFVAQVVAANQKKSYLLKIGDQLYDGDVVSISRTEVVFKQIVQDPTALKPFREVVKSLNPS